MNFQQISANFEHSWVWRSNDFRELESWLKLKGHRTRFRVRCPFFFCTFFARIHFLKRTIGSSMANSYRSHFGSRYHIDPHHCDPLFVGDNGFRKSHENCSFDAGKRKVSGVRYHSSWQTGVRKGGLDGGFLTAKSSRLSLSWDTCAIAQMGDSGSYDLSPSL